MLKLVFPSKIKCDGVNCDSRSGMWAVTGLQVLRSLLVRALGG